MAALQQRKLVHKQFNSPIGLYSEDNVKATINRELRAFSNGTVGIETHDQHKPGHLANSAVLKMLEEEENERVYPVVNERKSRPRQRNHQIFINRDTVLKINRRRPYHRRHKKDDFTWPPPPPSPQSSQDEQQQQRQQLQQSSGDDDYYRSCSSSRSRSRSVGSEERKRNEIFHLKKIFDTAAAATNKDANDNYYDEYKQKQQIKTRNSDIDDNDLNNNPYAYNVDCSICACSKARQYHDPNIGITSNHNSITKNSNVYGAERKTASNNRNDDNDYQNYKKHKSHHHYEWPPKHNTSYLFVGDAFTSNIYKTYYMPETEVHSIGIIEPKLRYFERAASNSPVRFRYHTTNSVDSSKLKRWKSNDFIEKSSDYDESTFGSSLFKSKQKSKSRQGLTLEHSHKSNSYNELPPLKPKRDNIQRHISTPENKLNNQMSGEVVTYQKSHKHDEHLNANADKENLVVKICTKCHETLDSDPNVQNKEIPLSSNSVISKWKNLAKKLKLTNHQNDENQKMAKSSGKIKKCDSIDDDDDEDDDDDDSDGNENVDGGINQHQISICFNCEKIIINNKGYVSYKILPLSKSTDIVTKKTNYYNYLATDTSSDAKNICNHNLILKINENIVHDDNKDTTTTTTNSGILLSSSSSSSLSNQCTNNGHHKINYENENENLKRTVGNKEEKENYRPDTTTIIKILPEIKQNRNITYEKRHNNNNVGGESLNDKQKTKIIKQQNKRVVVTVASVANLPASSIMTTTVVKTMIPTIKYQKAVEKNSSSLPAIVMTGYCRKDNDDDVKIMETNFKEILKQPEEKVSHQKYIDTTAGIKKSQSSGKNYPSSTDRTNPENFFTRKYKNDDEMDEETLKTINEAVNTAKTVSRKRKRGIYFTDGECIWGPYEKWPFEGEQIPEILKRRLEQNFSENENSDTSTDKDHYDNKKKFVQIQNENSNDDANLKEEEISKSFKSQNEEIESTPTSPLPLSTNLYSDSNVVDKIDENLTATTTTTAITATESGLQDKDEKQKEEESVTENSRQSDDYMKIAEQALNDAESQFFDSCTTADNILVFDTPLQDVIKDIFRKKPPLPPTSSSSILSDDLFIPVPLTIPSPPTPPPRSSSSVAATSRPPISYFTPKVSIVENSPIFEHVLLDLYNLSMAFDTMNSLASGISGYSLEDNKLTANGTEARIIELPVECNDNDKDNIDRNEVNLSRTISPHSVCGEDTCGSECHTSSSPPIITTTDEDTTKSMSPPSSSASLSPHVERIIQSKNILSGFLITKQNQEEAFMEAGINLSEHHPSTTVNPVDINCTNSIQTSAKKNSSDTTNSINEKRYQFSQDDILETTGNKNFDEKQKVFNIPIHLNNNDENIIMNTDKDNTDFTSHTHDNSLEYSYNNEYDSKKKNDKTDSDTFGCGKDDNVDDSNGDNFITNQQTYDTIKSKTGKRQLHFECKDQISYSHGVHYDQVNNKSKSSCNETINKDDKLIVEQKLEPKHKSTNNNDNHRIYNDYDVNPSSYLVSYADDEPQIINKNTSDANGNVIKIQNENYYVPKSSKSSTASTATASVSSLSNNNKEIKLGVLDVNNNHNNAEAAAQAKKNVTFDKNVKEQEEQIQNKNYRHRSRQFVRNADRIRSISQPPPLRTLSPHLLLEPIRGEQQQNSYDDNDIELLSSSSNRPRHPLQIKQNSYDSSDSRYYASPSLYMCGNFELTEGYRKVAWPPAETIPQYKASTPQPQQHYQQPQQGGHYYHQQQQHTPSSYHHQQQQSVSSGDTSYNQEPYYNNYPQQQSSFQQHEHKQHQPQQYYQQQHQQQRAPSNPPSSITASFCGGIPVKERSSSSPQHQSNFQQQSYPDSRYNQQPQQDYSQQSYIQQHLQQQQHHHQQQYQLQQHQQERPPSNSSATVASCGHIPVKERTPATSSSQSIHPQQSHQSQQISQTPESPKIQSRAGWSHIRGPTPTHYGYTQNPNYQSITPERPHGPGYESQFGTSQQNQFYHQPSQPIQSNQQPYQSSPVVGSYHPQQQPDQHQPYQQQPQQHYQPQSQSLYNQPESQYYHPQVQQPQQPHHQQQYPQSHQQYQPQQQQPQYQQLAADRGQSPGIITLRKETPMTQKPAPVVQSQPAAASFKGGANMRGDLKWPPPEVKAQMDAENEERIRITRSAPFRPRRVHKDYTQFFAKHALNSTYPGYRVPPGTQHVYAEY